MIRSFRDKKTERLFWGRRVKEWQSIEDRAIEKLLEIDAAANLNDLAVIPGNRLEPLKGKRSGQHSIRINDQYRVCFVWGKDNSAYDVEITDYH